MMARDQCSNSNCECSFDSDTYDEEVLAIANEHAEPETGAVVQLDQPSGSWIDEAVRKLGHESGDGLCPNCWYGVWEKTHELQACRFRKIWPLFSGNSGTLFCQVQVTSTVGRAVKKDQAAGLQRRSDQIDGTLQRTDGSYESC